MIPADLARLQLNYGGDDVTTALAALLQRSSFPYKDLDLTKPQDWLMMDNLKIKICTLEEVSLVAVYE
jgi:actin-related protein 8